MSLDSVLSQILSRLTAIEASIAAGGGGGTGAGGAGAGSASGGSDDAALSKLAADLDLCVLKTKGATAVEAAAKLPGAEAAVVAAALQQQLASMLEVVDMAGKCRKPGPDFALARKALLDVPRMALDALGGPKSPMPFPDLAKGCVEGAAAFLWPVLPTAPADTVQNGVEAAEFYHNKLRKWGKDNSKPEFGAFANAFRDVLKALGEWAKDNAKMGLAWNAKGGDVKDFKSVGGAAVPAEAATAAANGGPAAAAAAPASAAPMSAPAAATTAAAPVAATTAAAPATAVTAVAGSSAPAPVAARPAGALGSLFSQINSIDQSHGKTEGLRHVTKDMKSSSAKAEGTVVPAAAAPARAAAGAAPPKVPAAIKMGEAKTACKDGLRWEVEFHTKETQKGETIKIDGCSMRQEVYIYGCRDVAIDISTKVKGVRIDQCSNVIVLLSAALSGVEVVNSRRMKIQVREKLPSVTIDKTDGVLVGLSWVSRDAVITSSKSSEMNVTFPVSEKEDADWVECPIPEQFVSSITPAGKVRTTVSELYTS